MTQHYLKERLARLLYPYGSERTVLRGPARGVRYEVQPGIGLSYGLGLGADELRFMKRKIDPGMVVYDLGANRGQLTLLFARCAGPSGCVYAFEPVPAVHESLKHNIRLNGLSNVTSVCKAASDVTGHTSLAFDETSPTRGQVVGIEGKSVDREAQLLDVDTVALDDFVATEGVRTPDVVKIDVEGAGAAVLKGAAQLLEKTQPAVYIEVHGKAEQCSIREELMTRGYIIQDRKENRVSEPESYNVSYWCSTQKR